MSLTDDQRRRYARNMLLDEVGQNGQERLRAARVLVVGAGGLGAPVLMYLAAAGVGTLGVVDGDRVELSNLQRQICHASGDIGRPKANSAADTLGDINPEVTVETHALRLDAGAADRLTAAHDLVIDCTDNFATRFLINDACLTHRRPLVSGAVTRFDGQVAVFRPAAEPDAPCYRCLVPELPRQPRACAETGVLGAVCGIVGAWQATEALKELMGIGETLAGRLLIIDALGARVRVVRLRRDPDCPACGAA